MRADVCVRRGVIALVATLALFGCDDGDADPVADTGGAGGEGGEGGMGGMGGVPGDDMGPDDAGPDMAACDCERGVCDEMTGACVDADPCATDTECLDGNICDGGACVPGCADDAACAMADPATPLCIEGRCGDCRVDDDCFGAGACDPATYRCSEPDPCTDSRECAGDRVCIDGACGDRPSCADDGCPGGWQCLPSGECAPVRVGACADDDACGPGQVCVDGNPSVCGACRVDDDCPGTQLCVTGPDGNRCQEIGGCDTDDDCVGARACIDGNCAQPACVDDGVEPNDGPMQATAIAPGLYLGLQSCNDDWYSIELPADTTAEIIIRQADRGSDLALVVGDAQGNEFARSQTAGSAEAVVVGPFPDARPLTIRVEQVGPDSAVAYSLEVAFYADGDRCVDDAYDVGGSDDDRDTARRVRNPGDVGFPGDLSGRICPGDDDFLCFQINAREELTATVEVIAGNPVIVGELYDGDNELFEDAIGRWSRAEEPMDIVARGTPGTWCLRLYTESEAAGTYRVRLSAISPEVRALCGAAEPLPLAGGAVTTDDALPDNGVATPQCADRVADGGEKVYTITVDDPEQAGCAQNPCVYPPVMLTARAAGLPSGTLGDPVLSLRTTCADNDSEVACADDSPDPADPLFPRINPAVLRMPVTAPGDYTLIVDGVAVGDDPEFELSVDVAPLAAPPPNDSCDDAPTLDLLGGVAEVAANLGRARDDYAACLGTGGPDVAYAITLDRISDVRVQVLAQPNDFAVGAYLVPACDGAPALACGFGFERQVQPGDYFLVLDGADANARGRITAQIVVDPYPDSPPNETCDEAEALAAGGGSLTANTRGAGDDYRLVDGNPCTGHNTIGGDVVYRLPRQAEGRYFIEAAPIGGWDLALAVVNGCGDPAGERRACSDGALTESVVFDAPGSELFVIVDGTNGESGRFDLRWGPAECEIDIDCEGDQRCVDYACLDP